MLNKKCSNVDVLVVGNPLVAKVTAEVMNIEMYRNEQKTLLE